MFLSAVEPARISCFWMVVLVVAAPRVIFFFFFLPFSTRTYSSRRINKSAVYLGRKDVHYLFAIKHGSSALGEGQASHSSRRDYRRLANGVNNSYGHLNCREITFDNAEANGIGPAAGGRRGDYFGEIPPRYLCVLA